MISLIIFAITVGLLIWNKLPMATSAIIGCILMVLFGVADIVTVFSPFASNTVIMTIGVMIMGLAISESGLAQIIGRWVVNISKGSERRLMVSTYIVSAVMSAFMTNTAVLAIFIPIIMGVSAKNKNIQAKTLIMPIAIASVLGGGTTLVGSTQQLVAQGVLSELNERTFATFDLTPVGGLLVVIGLIYCIFIGYYRGKKIWGNEFAEAGYTEEEMTNEYRKPKVIIMGLIFIFTVVFYITEWIPIALTSTIGAILCIVTGCISQKEATKKVNWDIVGRLAGCLGVAKAVEIGGGSKILSDAFTTIIGDNLNPWLLFVIFIIITQVITQFVSASVTLSIILPVLVSIVPAMGLNTFAYVLGVTLASSSAFSNPLASTALGFSMTAGFSFKDYFRYSAILDIMLFITLITAVPLIYGLTA